MSSELLLSSLECVAEKEGDITDQVYERFFALCPAAYDLMGHSDEHMRGRMLEQVYELFFSDAHLGAGNYLDWELDNHLVGYQVEGDMYIHFFTALKDTIQTAMADEWRPDVARAWTDRIEAIMQQVRVHPAVA